MKRWEKKKKENNNQCKSKTSDPWSLVKHALNKHAESTTIQKKNLHSCQQVHDPMQRPHCPSTTEPPPPPGNARSQTANHIAVRGNMLVLGGREEEEVALYFLVGPGPCVDTQTGFDDVGTAPSRDRCHRSLASDTDFPFCLRETHLQVEVWRSVMTSQGWKFVSN